MKWCARERGLRGERGWVERREEVWVYYASESESNILLASSSTKEAVVQDPRYEVAPAAAFLRVGRKSGKNVPA